MMEEERVAAPEETARPAAQEVAPAAAPPPNQPPVDLTDDFLRDPVVYLLQIAAQNTTTSRQSGGGGGLQPIAGPVANWFAQETTGPAARAAPAYLQAAAVLLRTTSTQLGDGSQELVRTTQQYEILETVGLCATYCQSNRMAITTSGILPTLAHLVEHGSSSLGGADPFSNQNDTLEQAAVEFLQCALLAEQYRYAARIIQGTWPRPTSANSVKQVLRYYYLRGLIHLGCDDLHMAQRCFWTCLTVPAEVSSIIMVEAWKRLVLVQCLGSQTTSKTSIALPSAMPNCLARLLPSWEDVPASSTATTTTGSSNTLVGSVALSTLGGGFHNVLPISLQTTLQGGMEVSGETVDATFTDSMQQERQSLSSYVRLAEAFFKTDKDTLQTFCQQNESTWRTDGTLGLVNRLRTEQVYRQVRRLANLYTVVPLSKVVQILQVNPSYIQALLRQSGVSCQLSEDGMLTFTSGDDENHKPMGMPRQQESLVAIEEWIHLVETIQTLDVTISTNVKYHTLVRKEAEESSTKNQGEGPQGVEDI